MKTINKIKNTKKENLYDLTFKLNGEETKVSGETLEEAFTKLTPLKFATKGILTVKHEDKEIIRLFNILQMKRIFGIGGGTTQKIARDCTLKFIRLMLGEQINA